MIEPPQDPASPKLRGLSRERKSAGRELQQLSAERLASLSDTMFGVAMTLLATTLVPQAEQLNGSALEMLHVVSEPLSAIALSFAVAAIYWISQQRRLSMLEQLSPRQTTLHLGFLFLIMLLPISTGIFARRESAAAPVAIYGVHVTLIAVLNLALWLDVHRRFAVWLAVIPSAAAVVILGTGCAIGLFYPGVPQYVWYTALAIPLVTRFAHRLFISGGNRE
jgi:uncharacterized membrane protein